MSRFDTVHKNVLEDKRDAHFGGGGTVRRLVRGQRCGDVGRDGSHSRREQVHQALTPLVDREIRDASAGGSSRRRSTLARRNCVTGDGQSIAARRRNERHIKRASRDSRTIVIWRSVQTCSLVGRCTCTNSRRWELLNPHWDIVYVKDPVAITKLRLVGVDARLLHEAMNPRWHRVVSLRKGEDIVIYGNYYAYRQAIGSPANAQKESHWRSTDLGRPSWSHPEIKRTWRGRYIMGEEKKQGNRRGACLSEHI